MEELESKIFYLFKFLKVSPGVIMPWVCTLFLVSAAVACSRKMERIPNPLQNLIEFLCENLEGFLKNVVGEKHVKELFPFLATVFLYILTANMLGLVPGLKSPTGIFANCLGMALITFFATQYLGFSRHGLGYLKHFWGSPWWLGPLMFPIHVIGEFARPLSLTMRLFGNIMGEDVVILVLTTCLFPLIVPIPMICMALFTSLLQALVFTILSGLYLAGAVGSDDH